MAATRSLVSFGCILLFEVPYCFGKSPLLDVDSIIARAEYAASAHAFSRPLDRRLIAKALEQLVKQPLRHRVTLARIDDAEVEDRHQQHLPIELHVGEQPLPVHAVMALEDHVRDV